MKDRRVIIGDWVVSKPQVRGEIKNMGREQGAQYGEEENELAQSDEEICSDETRAGSVQYINPTLEVGKIQEESLWGNTFKTATLAPEWRVILKRKDGMRRKKLGNQELTLDCFGVSDPIRRNDVRFACIVYTCSHLQGTHTSSVIYRGDAPGRPIRGFKAKQSTCWSSMRRFRVEGRCTNDAN